MIFDISESEVQVVKLALATRAAVVRAEIDQNNDRQGRTTLRAELDCLAKVMQRFDGKVEPVHALA